MTMSTGGVSVVLANIPFRSQELYALGVMLFILTLVIFIISCICISIRFLRFRHTLKLSMLHPTESLFVAAGLLSIGTIIIASQTHGGPKLGDTTWFAVAMRVCFWVYSSVALVFTVLIHMMMYRSPVPLKKKKKTPLPAAAAADDH
jgi:tellurite resistance protein TehA-like permease